MQEKDRIERLKNYLRERRQIKLWELNADKLDTIHFFDVGDLTKIIYTLDWVLADSDANFLGVDDV